MNLITIILLLMAVSVSATHLRGEEQAAERDLQGTLKSSTTTSKSSTSKDKYYSTRNYGYYYTYGDNYVESLIKDYEDECGALRSSPSYKYYVFSRRRSRGRSGKGSRRLSTTSSKSSTSSKGGTSYYWTGRNWSGGSSKLNRAFERCNLRTIDDLLRLIDGSNIGYDGGYSRNVDYFDFDKKKCDRDCENKDCASIEDEDDYDDCVDDCQDECECKDDCSYDYSTKSAFDRCIKRC